MSNGVSERDCHSTSANTMLTCQHAKHCNSHVPLQCRCLECLISLYVFVLGLCHPLRSQLAVRGTKSCAPCTRATRRVITARLTRKVAEQRSSANPRHFFAWHAGHGEFADYVWLALSCSESGRCGIRARIGCSVCFSREATVRTEHTGYAAAQSTSPSAP